MAYAQINFNELQGRTNPKTGAKPKYSIRQIGCFLTAMCNLRSRFGADTSPLTLNAFFRDRGIYTDTGDGFYDDLWWNSISAFDPNITVTSIQGVGIPKTPHAIVKFTNHFSLVDHIDNGKVYIVDSADGKVKPASTYGGILGFATYGLSKPQAVQPPVVAPSPPAPPKVYATYHRLPAPQTFLTNKQPTNWWSLEFISWEEAKATKVMAQLNKDTPFTAVGFAEHWLGGKYYMTEGDFADADKTGKPVNNNGVNIEDLSVPAPPQPPIAEADAHHIPVTITPDSNEWKLSWKPETAEFIAKEDAIIKDLEGLQADIPISKGDKFHSVGHFTKGGTTYYRIGKHLMNSWWYGAPEAILERVEPPTPPPDDLEDEDSTVNELYSLDTASDDHEALVKATGQKDDLSVRVRHAWIKVIANVFGRFKRKQAKKQAK